MSRAVGISMSRAAPTMYCFLWMIVVLLAKFWAVLLGEVFCGGRDRKKGVVIFFW